MKRRNLVKNLGLIPLTGFIGYLFPFKILAGGPSVKTNNFVGGNCSDQGVASLGKTKLDRTAGKSIYERLGVRPVINGRGTITIIGGCRLLPEVEQAMQEATLDYVELDELMDGVGKRLAELTGAEFGMVTTG